MSSQKDSIIAIMLITLSSVGVILFGLINSKIIALLGGKESIAVLGLYQSTMAILSLVFSFGIARSLIIVCSQVSINTNVFISTARVFIFALSISSAFLGILIVPNGYYEPVNNWMLIFSVGFMLLLSLIHI